MKLVFTCLIIAIFTSINTMAQVVPDTLQQKSETLDEVVVTATKTSVSKNYVPVNVSVVNRQQIESSSESALLPVLSQQVPGLFITQRGVTGFGVSTGAAGTISMRGISGSPNSRVLVLINGNPQFMGIFGHPLADAYVASDVERVEVIHGAGSVLYGTNAMGGVVNIITRNQQQPGYSINARVLYGSFNTQKYMFSAGYRKKKFNAMLAFNNDRTDGHRANADFNIINALLKWNYTFSEHISIGAEGNSAHFKTTDPGPINGSKGQSLDIVRGAGYFYVSNRFSNTSGNIQLFYNYGNHKITDGFRSTDANYGVALYQSYSGIKNNTTTIGFDYKKYGGKAQNIFAMNGQGIVFGDHKVYEWAPYIFTQQSVAKKLVISAGFRIESNSVYGSIPVPSGGVSFLATANTTIKAAVSKAFRSPTIQELYLFPPANANLQPEKMMNYEASIQQQLLKGKLKLELTVFNVQGDNLIQTVFAGGAPKNVNTGVFNNTGIEFSAKYAPANHINIGVNYACTDMKYPVIAAPRHQFVLNSHYKLKGFDFNINLQGINGLYTQVVPATVASNYFLVNAKTGYTINPYVDVFVKGENLTNQKYEINNAYPMPGITVLGGVNFHFSK